MAEVTAYEAKTHLPRLLKRVEGGERITITRHGIPVAELVPVQRPTRSPEEIKAAIERMKAFRKGRTLGVPVRTLIEQGRR